MIDALRLIVGDPAGVDETFSYDELGAFLSRHRVEVFSEPLGQVIEATGARVFSSPLRWWADVELRSSTGSVVLPDVSYLEEGRWTFAIPRGYPLYITGASLDMYAAAADLLEAWAAKVKLQYNFSTGDLRLDRGARYTNLLDLAGRMRKKANVRSAQMVSSVVY